MKHSIHAHVMYYVGISDFRTSSTEAGCCHQRPLLIYASTFSYGAVVCDLRISLDAELEYVSLNH